VEHPARDWQTVACRLGVEETLRKVVQGLGSQRISPEGHTLVPEGVLPHHWEDETG
jgi:hypothetical protein